MFYNLLRPSSVVWAVLALLLAIVAILQIALPEIRIANVNLSSVLEGVSLVFGWVAASAVAGCLAWLGLITNHSSDRSVDVAFLVAAMCWLLLLGSEAAPGWVGEYSEMGFTTHAIYQVALISVAFFLLSCAPLSKSLGRALALLQAMPAMLLLSWGFLSGPIREVLYLGWQVANVMCATILFLYVAWTLRQQPNARTWLLSGVGLFGLSILLNDMALVDGMSIRLTAAHHTYAAFVALVWLLVTGRISDLERLQSKGSTHSENSVLANDFAHTGLNIDDASFASFASSQPDQTMTVERRRIAQELHDGVGSQLVNILSSLDRGIPQQRSLALALEQCLLDVKILVDDIDESSESVTDALGRLRYRVQHSLDKLGIQLVWDVDASGPLQTLQDERSRQILRIAQESIANVMRHSKARTLWVSCHCRLGHMVLEVRDDGVGFDHFNESVGKGKGIEGIRRRASACGGHLDFLSAPEKGTTVRITMALTDRRTVKLNGTHTIWATANQSADDRI